MGIDPAKVLEVANPMTENHQFLRNSPLPGLLGTEAISSKAAYPHRLFEVGKVAFPSEAENYGVSTRQYAGLLSIHAGADFNEIASQIATLLYYLGKDVEIDEPAAGQEDPRFIEGRQALVLHRGKPVGIYGELHPRLLDAWGIGLPGSAAELDLDLLAWTSGT
jgi:phenylalanyl-tRNA synthetase beta chain